MHLEVTSARCAERPGTGRPGARNQPPARSAHSAASGLPSAVESTAARTRARASGRDGSPAAREARVLALLETPDGGATAGQRWKHFLVARTAAPQRGPAGSNPVLARRWRADRWPVAP